MLQFIEIHKSFSFPFIDMCAYGVFINVCLDVRDLLHWLKENLHDPILMGQVNKDNMGILGW